MDFVVTPYDVEGEVDYEKLTQLFGTQKIDEALLNRLKKYCKESHLMLRRNIFYSHRDLNLLLDDYEKGIPFVLYTGRGPSGETHLGHLIPYMFTKYLQDCFKTKLYFQLTDDEKFLFKDKLTLEDTHKLAVENLLDLIACGFESKNTDVIIDTDQINRLYPLALQVAKKVTFSTAKAVFGFNESTNIGSIFFTSIQSAPAFLPSIEAGKKVNCLIPCAIDQDPHFRVTRDVAPKLGYPKPALIHSKFMPGLGEGGKMSASKPETAIFTTDTPKEAKKKVMSAFTGGRETIEQQKKLGGQPDKCSVFMYYAYLFEPNDDALKELQRKCKAGEIMCGECKQILAERVLKFLEKHQEKREKAKEIVAEFIGNKHGN